MEEFSEKFAAEATINAGEEDFDPFGIGVDPATNANDNNAFSADFGAADDSKSILSVKSSASSALPPRIMVKFKVEEEVSSTAHISNVNEGSSDVQIVGTVLAQVVSSDALKNIPFFLMPSTDNKETVHFMPNETYAKKFQDDNNSESESNTTVVTIPKEILQFVNVGSYRISQSMEHMPLLLEQKVVRSKSKIQIAIQVRSKLSNPDDLSEFSIALYIPKKVDEKSVSVATGDGEFDLWKRCITWEKQNLPKGQSFMVSAKCAVDENSEPSCEVPEDEELNFPVMLRCRSKDQISTFRVQAVEAEGFPASVSSSVVGKSYRIIHRLK